MSFFSSSKVFFIIFLLPSLALSQITKVSGKVYDAETKEPLPFVSISFKGIKVSTTSDVEGNYSVSTSTPTDTLVFSFIGYKVEKKAIKKGVSQVLNVNLQSDITTIPVVDVIAGENPAIIILRKVIKAKIYNDKEKLDSYQYEVYNKIEFDLRI